MEKQLVVLVHGMGTHPKGNIKQEFTTALGDRAKSFGLQDNTFLNNVDYFEFNYSEYFDAVRKQFSENAQARKKGFSHLAGKGFEEKLLNQLTTFESKFGRDEFFYTHWLDVILYSTMYFGEKLRVDFSSLLDKKISKYDHKNIHIVCHSLGAALVHDALAKYYRSDANPFDNIPDKKVGEFNISSLWTFANVSRMVNIINNLIDPYNSTVVTGIQGCTSRLINIVHAYDPFTWFKTYDRDMTPKERVSIDTIREFNTHDFYEYITEPRISREILKTIYDIKITKDQFSAGNNSYNETLITTQANALKSTIDNLHQDPSITSITQAITKFKELRDTIDALEKP